MPCDSGNTDWGRLGLCDDLVRWDGVGVGGRFRRERTHVYLWLVLVDVWQRLTQYCKAVIFPSKVNFKKKFLRKYETKGYVFTTQCGKMEGSEDGEGGGVE